MWLALERLLEAGKARSIGVSNYGVGHIEEMKEYAKIWPPHVNQIEVCSDFPIFYNGEHGALTRSRSSNIATSLVPTEDHYPILRREQNYNRSLLSSRQEPKSTRSNTRNCIKEAWKDHCANPDPLLLTKRLGTATKERYA